MRPLWSVNLAVAGLLGLNNNFNKGQFMEFFTENWGYFTTAFLSIVSIILGLRGLKYESIILKAKQLTGALKESTEAVDKLVDAIQDKKVSAEEEKQVAKEFKESKEAWKLVFLKNEVKK